MAGDHDIGTEDHSHGSGQVDDEDAKQPGHQEYCAAAYVTT
jgi:hypothetical protein